MQAYRLFKPTTFAQVPKRNYSRKAQAHHDQPMHTLHSKKANFKFAGQDPAHNTYQSDSSTDTLRKAGNAVAQGMNSLADGINTTSKIITTGLMVGGSIAATGIETAGRLVKSTMPPEMTNISNNPLAAGFDMLTKVGKQAVDTALDTANQMANQVQRGVNSAAQTAGLDTKGTYPYNSNNVSDQTARVASEAYRGASDIAQAAMQAGAQVLKTATNEAATMTNSNSYTDNNTSFHSETTETPTMKTTTTTTSIPKKTRTRRTKKTNVEL